ncbi:Serine/threonine-protein kinase ICK [Camelus dromedarius]|uniref:Serine/threonine-protein kinase ICK n=1 Tax=Camelus dromedarius TaxID=9838 RepID=A0A5N4CRQ6_CAMDR|nr:Serine/threonine-protein kinase ICK [Camelus dromedarius]
MVNWLHEIQPVTLNGVTLSGQILLLKQHCVSFQALRYPYFQIGHPLGSTTQSLQDSGKPQKDILEKAGPPPHIKPVPPAQPPTKPHARISSRQHQASQPPQHLLYSYKAEAARTDHPPEDKPSPLHLPPLHTKHPQAKILTSLEHKNGEIKPKSRRRWGLVSRSTKDSDDWADLDDSDFSPSFTRIDLKNKKRQSEEALCRQGRAAGPPFESVLDLKPSESGGAGSSAPTQTSYPRRDTPTLRSAAKQHYLRHSRYLPGINIRNGILPNPGKDFIPSNPWSSSGLSGKSSGTVSVISKINSVGSCSTSSSGLAGNYIPSFLKKEIGSAMQRVHLAPIPDPSPDICEISDVAYSVLLGLTSALEK